MKTKATPDERAAKELAKGLRYSRPRLPLDVIMTLLTGILVWRWPFWLTWIAFGVSVFTLTGDTVNIAYCEAKLKRIGHQGKEAEPPVPR